MLLVLRHGLRGLKGAVGPGQWHLPRGLFYGGKTLEAGPAKFQTFIEERLAGAEHIVAIDVHTGLGRFGEDRLLVDSAVERGDVNRAMREVYGDRAQLLEEGGVAYPVRGAQYEMYYRLFQNARIYFAAQEFGTYHPLLVVAALRAENRWHHYGGGAVDHPTKKGLLVDV